MRRKRMRKLSNTSTHQHSILETRKQETRETRKERNEDKKTRVSAPTAGWLDASQERN